MINLDKKLFFFGFANGISLLFGFLLYILIFTTSDQNLAKFMFGYSIQLIMGSLLTFGSSLYIFNDLCSKDSLSEKILIFEKNIFFILIILFISLLIVFIFSILDYIYFPYKKNFEHNLYPLFFSSLLFALNKILFFSLLGFKFYKNCYFIIIIRPFVIFLTVFIFMFFTKSKFEISVVSCFIICEAVVFILSVIGLKKIFHSGLEIFRGNCKFQILNSMKLFGEYIFAEIIMKIDIFFSMLKFELKDISIYLTSLIFIEGLLTFTVVMRNYFSSQFGVLIFKKNYAEYIKKFKKYSMYSLLTSIFFTFCSVLSLIIINKFIVGIDFLVFKYFSIMVFGYLTYSFFAVSELIFLNNKNYFKQTTYFIVAIFSQLFLILLLINSLGILSFAIAICSMYLVMSVIIANELIKLNLKILK